MQNNILYDKILKLALKEDIGTGDITTLSTVPKEKEISGKFIAKQEGIVCGIFVVQRIFQIIDKNIVVDIKIEDGQKVKVGDIIAQIKGNARGILTGERTALNFLQRLSGIATKTSIYADLLKDTKTVVSDTRKTTPGLRVLEKYAVKTGGGANHRFNLADGVLIKDNHIAAANGITKAINSAKAHAPHTIKIEIEVESLEQVMEALDAKADIIMLDNMDIGTMEKAVQIIDGKAIIEASGNMEDKNLLDIANTGVDIISIGGLTHSVKAMDISLRLSN